MELAFRPMKTADWNTVAEIYKQGIETGNATFQQEIPEWEVWDKGHLTSCRLVAMVEDEIIAWAALSPVSSRQVYSGVAEVSIYVNNMFRGQKVGTQLMKKLIEESENTGFWTLQAGIFPENESSLRIHASLGFRVIGYREKVGKMNDVWRDTILLERRSKRVGIG